MIIKNRSNTRIESGYDFDFDSNFQQSNFSIDGKNGNKCKKKPNKIEIDSWVNIDGSFFCCCRFCSNTHPTRQTNLLDLANPSVDSSFDGRSSYFYHWP